MGMAMEKDLMGFLLLALVLLLSAKGLEALFRPLGFPSAGAGVLAGILWGPGIAGRILPGAFAMLPGSGESSAIPGMQALLLAGALLVSFDLGMDLNLPLLRKQGKKTLRLGIRAVLLPLLAIGAAAGLIAWSGILYPGQVSGSTQAGWFSGGFAENPVLGMMFVILMMALPSLPQSLDIMRKVELLKTDLGLLSARLLSGTTILLFAGLAAVLVLAGPGRDDALTGTWKTLLAILFMVAALVLVRPLMNRIFRLVHKNLGNLTRTNETVLTLAGLSMAILGMLAGLPALGGTFLAGLTCGASRFLNQQTRDGLRKSARAAVIPLFFALMGFRLDPLGDLNLPLTLGIAGLAILFRSLGAFAGGRSLRLGNKQALILSLLQVPGGEVQLLFGFMALGMGLVNQELLIALCLGTLLPGFLSGMFLQGLVFREPRVMHPWGLQHHIREHSPDLEGLNPKFAQDSQDELLARPGIELVLRTLCYDPEVRKGCDPETTLQALLEREEAFSTALGRGLAVPHAEIPGLLEFTVFAARSETALDWNAPDGEGTRVFVLILIPPGHTPLHLQFLKQLARTWSRLEARNDCLTCPAKEFPSRLRFWMGNPPDQS